MRIFLVSMYEMNRSENVDWSRSQAQHGSVTLREDDFPSWVRYDARCRTSRLEEGLGVEGWRFVA